MNNKARRENTMLHLGSLLFYLVVFSISAILVSKGKHTKLFPIIGIFILIIISAIRYGVGSDFFSYMYQLNSIKLVSWGELLKEVNLFNEPGFLFLKKITSILGGGVVFWGTCSAIVLLLFYVTLKKQYYHVSIGLAFVFFIFVFFPSSFNITRQFISGCIVFYSFKYVFEKNIKKYLLFVFVAFLFHISAITAIPIYFLWDAKRFSTLKAWKLVFVLAIIVLTILNYQVLIELVSRIHHFQRYFVYSLDKPIGYNRDFYLNLLISLFLIILRKKLVRIDKRNELFILLFIISLAINITGFINPYIKRIGFYYELPLTIITGYIPYLFKDNSKLIIKIIVVLYALIYFVIVYYVLGHSEIFPYKTYFSQ